MMMGNDTVLRADASKEEAHLRSVGRRGLRVRAAWRPTPPAPRRPSIVQRAARCSRRWLCRTSYGGAVDALAAGKRATQTDAPQRLETTRLRQFGVALRAATPRARTGIAFGGSGAPWAADRAQAVGPSGGIAPATRIPSLSALQALRLAIATVLASAAPPIA